MFLTQPPRQKPARRAHVCSAVTSFQPLAILTSPSQSFSRACDQGWFHGRRWLVWLFPLTYPSYRVLLMSRESAKCSFLKKKFFYNNSPIYSNNLIASKKLVTRHPLGRHIPIPYSSWTETYQKNHLSKKKNSIFWLIYREYVKLIEREDLFWLLYILREYDSFRAKK